MFRESVLLGSAFGLRGKPPSYMTSNDFLVLFLVISYIDERIVGRIGTSTRRHIETFSHTWEFGDILGLNGSFSGRPQRQSAAVPDPNGVALQRQICVSQNDHTAGLKHKGH